MQNKQWRLENAEAQQQELAAEKLLNQRLKDKLVEMLLDV